LPVSLSLSRPQMTNSLVSGLGRKPALQWFSQVVLYGYLPLTCLPWFRQIQPVLCGTLGIMGHRRAI